MEKRERDREWEKKKDRERKITQFEGGSINGPSNRGKVGLMVKLDEPYNLQWPLRSYLFK